VDTSSCSNNANHTLTYSIWLQVFQSLPEATVIYHARHLHSGWCKAIIQWNSGLAAHSISVKWLDWSLVVHSFHQQP